MIMDVIKANKKIVKKVLFYGGCIAVGAIAAVVLKTEKDTEGTESDDCGIIDLDDIEVELDSE